MKEKKKLIIGILSVLIVVMAVGYALLAQELTINGRASIDSTWKVEITNITQKELVGGTVEKNKSYNATTANFDVEFSQPGDSITYDIEVTNKGTLDAVITNINVITTNDQEIKYVTSGLKKGDKLLKNGGKNYLTIKIEYDSSITSQPLNDNNDITIELDYQQNLGQISPYEAYLVGDKITFAGSNWYVIKNSNGEDDYVSLIKETILSSDELGGFSLGDISGYRYNVMAYYWNDSCHNSGVYEHNTYTSSLMSGCYGHNDYVGSKVKEFLEGTYINTLGTNNLKEIDGYKIRLITADELVSNFGFEKRYSSGYNLHFVKSDSTPVWIYRNFGERQQFWTMTPYNDNDISVYYVSNSGKADRTGVNDINSGVRPVINLLKDAIE